MIATAGEILGEDDGTPRSSATAPRTTRACAPPCPGWRRRQLLTREENRVQVFPSSLRVGSVAEARDALANKPIESRYRQQLEAIAEMLIDADPDEGITTDELMGASGLNPEEVRRALHDLERLGIADNDTAVTAFVHVGVPQASRSRLEEAVGLERALIEHLREAAPDMEKEDASTLHLRVATQRLKDAGHGSALPERVWRVLQSLARDGRGERDDRGGSLSLRRLGPEAVRVRLLRTWEALAETAERRRIAGLRLLRHLLASLPDGVRGTDLLAETTFGKLLAAIRSDLMLKARAREPEKLLDRALLWLHEQEVIRLNKGLSVFRPAMSIHLSPVRRGFANPDFTPLRLHYQDQVLQDPRDGGVRAARPEGHGRRAAAGDGLLSAPAGGLPAPLAAGPATRTSRARPRRNRGAASWRASVTAISSASVADDREQANVLCAGGTGRRKDAGAGPPHRVSRAGTTGEPARRARAGLQPACRRRDSDDAWRR